MTIPDREIDKLIDTTAAKTDYFVQRKHDQKIEHITSKDSPKLLKPCNIRNEIRKRKRLEHRKPKQDQRKKTTMRYRDNVKRRKVEALKGEVDRIKAANIVLNLSSVEIPDFVFIYLAHGLNFVESKIPKVEDLRFDLNDFVRKLTWKTFFSKFPSEGEEYTSDVHSNMRVKSNKYPSDFTSPPLLEDIKGKVSSWITNFEPEEPKPNLTPQAQRGKKWISEATEKQQLFVTKADKGGSILILNYSDVESAMEKELSQVQKYELQKEDPDAFKKKVVKNTREVIMKLEEEGKISSKDKEIITGLGRETNHLKHNPEFRPSDPTMYPLFKVHKLNEQQIADKMVPPARFVNNTKFGPLYRIEKWMSPYLSTVSQSYCADEYIRDTDDFISQIEEWNMTTLATPRRDREKFHLFTLDVKALYPSIRPDLAQLALADALEQDNSLSEKMKKALVEMTKLLFDNSYITCKGKCYKLTEGIPTGGCNSRQNADSFLHWLLEYVKGDVSNWRFIKQLKRFIDDIFGIWKGTERQFFSFVEDLNTQTRLFGIEFGDFDVGDSVHFLDVTVYIDEDGLLQYKLYRKPTDSRHYLQFGSFHPSHVFDSVAYSQMLRVTKRNSVEEQARQDVQELKTDLGKCGYKEEILMKLEEKLERRINEDNRSEAEETTTVITAVVDYFTEINSLKSLLKGLEPDISRLLEEPTRVLVASRKGPAIRSNVVKNKLLCAHTPENRETQRCNGRNCKSCPQMQDEQKLLVVNGVELKPSRKLTCKSNNVIYVAQCSLCEGKPIDSAYVGQTQQRFHLRANGHRSCFVADDPETIEKSALALHASEKHPDNFTMKIFNFVLLDSVQGSELNRREARAINELRTNVMGLNRMKVQKSK